MVETGCICDIALLPAMTGRPELIRLMQPRAKTIFTLIDGLLETNQASA